MPWGAGKAFHQKNFGGRNIGRNTTNGDFARIEKTTNAFQTSERETDRNEIEVFRKTSIQKKDERVDWNPNWRIDLDEN